MAATAGPESSVSQREMEGFRGWFAAQDIEEKRLFRCLASCIYDASEMTDHMKGKTHKFCPIALPAAEGSNPVVVYIYLQALQLLNIASFEELQSSTQTPYEVLKTKLGTLSPYRREILTKLRPIIERYKQRSGQREKLDPKKLESDLPQYNKRALVTLVKTILLKLMKNDDAGKLRYKSAIQFPISSNIDCMGGMCGNELSIVLASKKLVNGEGDTGRFTRPRIAFQYSFPANSSSGMHLLKEPKTQTRDAVEARRFFPQNELAVEHVKTGLSILEVIYKGVPEGVRLPGIEDRPDRVIISSIPGKSSDARLEIRTPLVLAYLYSLDVYVNNVTIQRRSVDFFVERFRRLFRGLDHCHFQAGVVHNDIKMENIFWTEDNELLLGDWGGSSCVSDLSLVPEDFWGHAFSHSNLSAQDMVALASCQVDELQKWYEIKRAQDVTALTIAFLEAITNRYISWKTNRYHSALKEILQNSGREKLAADPFLFVKLLDLEGVTPALISHLIKEPVDSPRVNIIVRALDKDWRKRPDARVIAELL